MRAGGQFTYEIDQITSRPHRMWTCLENCSIILRTFLPYIATYTFNNAFCHVDTYQHCEPYNRAAAHAGWTRLGFLHGEAAENLPDILYRMQALLRAGDDASGSRYRLTEDGRGLLAEYTDKCGWIVDWYLSKLPSKLSISGEAGIVPLVAQVSICPTLANFV